MDCKHRRSFLLFYALTVYVAGIGQLHAQDSVRAGSPGVNTPTTISNGTFRHSSNDGTLTVPASAPNDDRRDPSHSTTSGLPQTSQSTIDVPIPLKPRSGPIAEDSGGADAEQTGSSSAGAILTALVVFLLFLLGLAKLFLKRSPYAIRGLPLEAIDVLGRRAVDPRNSIYMVKVGSRMILLGSSPGGLSSLAEITDPIEIASLANICAAAQQSRPDAARWLGKLWPNTSNVVESRLFEDQLGEKLFDEAQRGEPVQVNSLTVSAGQERHRAG